MSGGRNRTFRSANSPSWTELVQRAEAIKGKRGERRRRQHAENPGRGPAPGQPISGFLTRTPQPIRNGKVAAAIERMFQIWQEGTGPAQCQIVFCDMGVPNSKNPAGAPPKTDSQRRRPGTGGEEEED